MAGGQLRAEQVPDRGEKLLVAAAANLAVVADALGQAFERIRPGCRIDWVFGASGSLATQIANGAPFSVFLSADTKFPEYLSKRGIGLGKPVVYARGELILLSTRPLAPGSGLSILAGPGIRQVAIANPETAPYGAAALQALERTGLLSAVSVKLVTAQSVTQAVQFILQVTGIGLVPRSTLFAPGMDGYRMVNRYWFAIDRDTYDPVDHAFLVIGPNPEGGPLRAFADFLISADARRILVSYGYEVP